MQNTTPPDTCRALDALAPSWCCSFVVVADARPLPGNLDWWSNEEIADLGWGVVDDVDGEETCEEPEPQLRVRVRGDLPRAGL